MMTTDDVMRHLRDHHGGRITPASAAASVHDALHRSPQFDGSHEHWRVPDAATDETYLGAMIEEGEAANPELPLTGRYDNHSVAIAISAPEVVFYSAGTQDDPAVAVHVSDGDLSELSTKQLTLLGALLALGSDRVKAEMRKRDAS